MITLYFEIDVIKDFSILYANRNVIYKQVVFMLYIDIPIILIVILLLLLIYLYLNIVTVFKEVVI